jgi:TonB-dependent SusC/RagA subfamily outer membrane receptor
MIAFAYYLLKVVICSAVLFLYYHLALRNKLFHQWNRFYLLASVVLSLVAPIIQITIVRYTHETSNKAIELLQVLNSADGYMEEITITANRGISSEQWMLIAYCLASFIVLIITVLSLFKILSVIKSHTVRVIRDIKFINTKVKGTPFSFFKFIFWNEEIDLQTETGQQIFQHELVHVREKHSVDKLFIQSVLIFFWCNPFFWFIRRELKLVHEFIADKKAVGEHGTAALAAMILNASYPSQFNSLTNQFFQTSIKRRLAMLTKIQNPRVNYISRVLALPILALTVLAFSLKTKSIVSSPVKLDKKFTVVIDAGHGLMPDGKYNGAKVGDIYEDNITLSIANKIKELNTNDKIKIILTRPTSEIVDLQKRIEIAKENDADLFVSVHLNMIPSNASANTANSMDVSSKGFEVLVSNKQTAYQKQSELFASALQQELSSAYTTNSSLLKPKTGVWVLDQNICPSALIECGYLSDKNDRKFIADEKNQELVAKKILQGIERYALAQQENGASNVSWLNIQNRKDTVPKRKATGMKISGLDPNSKNTPLIIVDGKETNKDEADRLDPSSIEAISVFKGPDATKTYGNKGVNGVIEIKLKKSNSNVPLYVLDGKIVSKKEVEKIKDPSLIESIDVLKDKSATEKYGEKGANGVIEIKLKPSKNEEGIKVGYNGKSDVTIKSKAIVVEPHFTVGETNSKDTLPKTNEISIKVEEKVLVDKKQ